MHWPGFVSAKLANQKSPPNYSDDSFVFVHFASAVIWHAVQRTLVPQKSACAPPVPRTCRFPTGFANKIREGAEDPFLATICSGPFVTLWTTNVQL